MPNHAQILAENYENIRTAGACIYQMKPCSPSQMMGYVIRTREGRLFLVDGGKEAETEAFLTLARRAVGCPDDAVLHIDGWFLTHPHSDHVDVFLTAMERLRDTIAIDRLYLNFPTTAFVEAHEGGEAYTMHAYDALEDVIAPIRQIVHTGDHIEYPDVCFDILAEPNETFTGNAVNNASIAVRMTLEGQRVLFLGDMGEEAGRAMLAACSPKDLRADFVEAAHHGQNGVTMDVYAAIQPRAVLWCTPDWLWTNNAGQGYGTGPWTTFTTRCFMDDLGVKSHFIEKDGIWEIPLPFAFE